MKKYLLKQDLFDHKAGEEIEIESHGGPQIRIEGGPYYWAETILVDIYTRLGVLEEIDGEWKPRMTGLYFYITSKGEVGWSFWENLPRDLYRLSIGNVHRTEKLAKAYKASLIKK